MIRLIKKRIQAFKDMPRHLSYVPRDNADPVYNMTELVELSKRYGSGFKIIGDHKKFTIAARSVVLNFMTIMISLYLIIFTGLAIYLREPIIGIIIVGGLCLMILALKLGPLLFYNITVDAYTQKITVKSNNAFGFIGKWIRPGFETDFSRFKKLSSESKVRKSWAGDVYTVHHVNRIFIEYDEQKRAVIDFSDEINHTIFVICLTRLIKRQ